MRWPAPVTVGALAAAAAVGAAIAAVAGAVAGAVLISGVRAAGTGFAVAGAGGLPGCAAAASPAVQAGATTSSADRTSTRPPRLLGPERGAADEGERRCRKGRRKDMLTMLGHAPTFPGQGHCCCTPSSAGRTQTGVQARTQVRIHLRIQVRIRVLLPNRLSIRSTASSAVLLRRSSAGLSSITSRLASRPVSAIISMHSCASR